MGRRPEIGCSNDGKRKAGICCFGTKKKNTEERYGSLAIAGKKLNIPVLTCDATALKTVARNNITLYLMNGPVVKAKWGGNDIEKALDK